MKKAGLVFCFRLLHRHSNVITQPLLLKLPVKVQVVAAVLFWTLGVTTHHITATLVLT